MESMIERTVETRLVPVSASLTGNIDFIEQNLIVE